MKEYPKTFCEFCSKFISNNNIEKHKLSHLNNPNYQRRIAGFTYQLDHNDLFCKFCGKECKNKNSLIQHEIRCKNNPDRQTSVRNKFNNIGRNAWNKGLTKETHERVVKNSLSVKKFYQEHPEKKPGGYKKSSARSYKYGTYRGFYCDSSWELAFIIYCLDNNIEVVRNEIGFQYINSDGQQKEFYPDFIVNSTYYEIKGGYDTQTEYKINQFPYNLVLLNYESIQPYLQYAKNTYGKDFIRLYDRNYPSWMDKESIE